RRADSPAPCEVLLHACRRCFGVSPAAADHRAGETAQRQRHLGGLCPHPGAVEHHRPIANELAPPPQHPHPPAPPPPAALLPPAPAATSGRTCSTKSARTRA